MKLPALACFLGLVFNVGFGPCRLFPSKSNEALIADHLAGAYEQPYLGMWEDGKVYYLPDDSGIALLPHGDSIPDLSIYKASLWFIHWAPEEFPVVVWVTRRNGAPEVDMPMSAETLAAKFPDIVKDVSFKEPRERRNATLLVGEMLALGTRRPSELKVTHVGACDRLEWAGAYAGAKAQSAAVCFSDNGSLKSIDLPQLRSK